MTATKSVKWTQVIDTIIDNYNNTYHTGIKMKPIDALNSWFKESIIIQRKREKTEIMEKNIIVFNINDKVRKLNISKNTFENKMKSKYGSEIYIATKLNKNTI